MPLSLSLSKAIDREMILFEFCRLGLVERGLPLYIKQSIEEFQRIVRPAEIKDSFHARQRQVSTTTAIDAKTEAEVNDPNFPSILHKRFLANQKKVGEFEPENENWSYYEMDEENYNKLINVYKEVFPGRFDSFEELRRKSLDDIDYYYLQKIMNKEI